MPEFYTNFGWIAENVGLAFLGVFFCYLFLRSRQNLFKVLFFILWVLFIPNTIYLITDIQYFPKQFLEAEVLVKILLIFQYLVVFLLGIISYIGSLYPIEVFLSRVKKNRQYTPIFIFLFNFLIGFAVALGKIQRTQSWHIFTEPLRVLNDFYSSAVSSEIMLFVIVFGLVLNVLYFFITKTFKNELKGLTQF